MFSGMAGTWLSLGPSRAGIDSPDAEGFPAISYCVIN
jgi:hypothetical protein